MKKLCLFFLAFTLSSAVYAVESFSTLQERMSGKEFADTGLAKLTDKELATLNDWLSRHSVATLENATAGTSQATAVDADQASSESDNKIIRSTIVGTFEGWSGKETIFTLANGQLWQQAEKDIYYAEPATDVQVEIRKPRLGKWKMTVVGTNRDLRVKRIQ